MNLSQRLRLTGFLVYLCFSLSSCATTDSNVPNQYDDRMKKIIWGEIKEKTIMESLNCIKRAGADWSITYFAKVAAQYLR